MICEDWDENDGIDFCQCRLVHQAKRQEQVVWIPCQYAKRGMVLRLLGGSGAWEDGWLVKDIFGKRKGPPPETHKRLRKYTDFKRGKPKQDEDT